MCWFGNDLNRFSARISGNWDLGSRNGVSSGKEHPTKWHHGLYSSVYADDVRNVKDCDKGCLSGRPSERVPTGWVDLSGMLYIPESVHP